MHGGFSLFFDIVSHSKYGCIKSRCVDIRATNTPAFIKPKWCCCCHVDVWVLLSTLLFSRPITGRNHSTQQQEGRERKKERRRRKNSFLILKFHLWSRKANEEKLKREREQTRIVWKKTVGVGSAVTRSSNKSSAITYIACRRHCGTSPSLNFFSWKLKKSYLPRLDSHFKLPHRRGETGTGRASIIASLQLQWSENRFSLKASSSPLSRSHKAKFDPQIFGLKPQKSFQRNKK